MRFVLFLTTAPPIVFRTANATCKGVRISTLLGSAKRYNTRIQPTETVCVFGSSRSKSGSISRFRFRRWVLGKRKRLLDSFRFESRLVGVTVNLFAAASIAYSQVLTPFTPATGQNAAAILGRHSRAESVFICSLSAARLIRTLHYSLSRSIFSFLRSCVLTHFNDGAEIIQAGKDTVSFRHFNESN